MWRGMTFRKDQFEYVQMSKPSLKSLKYEDALYKVSYENFVQIAKEHPELKSVIRGTKHEFLFTGYGDGPPCFQFIYVEYKKNFSGYMLQIPWKVEDFYGLLLEFVYDMCRSYDLINPVKMFNTYLSHVRDTLEHFGVHTISVFEAQKEAQRLGDMEGILLSPTGTEIIPFYKPKEFYFALLDIKELESPIPDKTYVYVMLDSNTGYFKIGRSKTPFKRERTLQSQNPEYSLLFYWQRSQKLETELHHEFRKKRMRGEWFKLTIDDLYKLKEMVDSWDS